MDDRKRLELIAEAVLYCKRVAAMGMPVAAYTKAVREPIHFLWTLRAGSKDKAAKYYSRAAMHLTRGRREICFDHAIPFRYQLRALMALTQVTPKTVRPVLEKFGVYAILTADEHAKLKNEMPRGWDGKDPLARYKAAGIKPLVKCRQRKHKISKKGE